MKVIIAGGRSLEVSHDFIDKILADSQISPSLIVSGASGRPEDEFEVVQYANGIDGCGEKWATQNKIPIKRFPAKFKSAGKSAGPFRNRKMAEFADLLVLIWDGQSKGSSNMRFEMLRLKKPIIEKIVQSTGET